MSYAAPADFRDDSLAFFARGCVLKVDEADDTELVAEIAAVGQRIDATTGDHFEPVTEAIDLDISAIKSTRLYLPRRIRTVTTIETRDADGALTAQAAGVYRVRSSLNAAGTDFSDSIYDYIDIIEGKSLTTGAYWPIGSQIVRITGAWHWAAVPGDIKRATALLVHDHFKPIGDNTRRADRWQTVGGTIYERPGESASGLLEVDGILERFRRLGAPGF